LVILVIITIYHNNFSQYFFHLGMELRCFRGWGEVPVRSRPYATLDHPQW